MMFASLLFLSGLALATPVKRQDPTPQQKARDSAEILLSPDFYNSQTGRWKGSKNFDMWWQSGVILEAIVDLGIQDPEFKDRAVYAIDNSYNNGKSMRTDKDEPWISDWTNDFYDDNGWWALAWCKAYDLTGKDEHLELCKKLYAPFEAGKTLPPACSHNGWGIWWTEEKQNGKRRPYATAISNNLYFSVAAHLANRDKDASRKQGYIDAAKGQWEWLMNKGLRNQTTGLFEDSLNADFDCSLDTMDKSSFTYNQGTAIGGLVELAKATNDNSWLAEAQTLADNSQKWQTEVVNDIVTLKEWHPPAGDQGAMFRGAHVSGLANLQASVGAYGDFIKGNAQQIWNHARQPETGRLEVGWTGQNAELRVITTSGHASATRMLIAAAAVA